MQFLEEDELAEVTNVGLNFQNDNQAQAENEVFNPLMFMLKKVVEVHMEIVKPC